jgi:GNAT superfamily N-acetyltransferase
MRGLGLTLLDVALGPAMAEIETPMTLDVRRARWADVPEVHAAYRAQPDETRRLYHPFPFGSVRLSLFLRALWATGHAGPRRIRWLPRTAAVLLVARSVPSGELAGFGTLRFRKDRDGHLIARTGLFVVPGHRRSGIGRALKIAMMERGRALGATGVEAFLLATNTASAELNRSLGFRLRPWAPGDPTEAKGLMIAEMELAASADPHRPGTLASPVDASVAADPVR